MAIVRNFNLFLNAGHSIPLVINANQYDRDESWVFTLFNSDGTQYVPSTGAIVGIKSDGLGIINSGSVVDGKVVITETQQMTAAPGKAVFELMIDSGTHGTANFIVLVEPKPGDNADLSDSDLSLIQEALDAVNPLPTGGSVGQVLTKTANGSAWSDAGTPTQEQVADAVSDWADEHITVSTGVVIDTSLSVAGAAADAKKTGDEITDLKSAIQSGGSFTADVKAALEELLEHVAYIDDDGQTYLDALHSAMYPTATLSYITAVYTQSGTVYEGGSLNSLKSDLVVTAHYSDATTAVVSDYVLSGSLIVGTSTITVTYGGKTATFNVTVTARMSYSLSDGSLDIEKGAIDWTSADDILTNTSTTPVNQPTRRRNVGILHGVKPYNNIKNDVTTVEDRYPIPVPSNATSCTYTITPSTQFAGAAFYTYDTSTNMYTRTNDVGWKQGSHTLTFTAGTYDYMTIATKYNSSGSSYPTEPSEITITFE